MPPIDRSDSQREIFLGELDAVSDAPAVPANIKRLNARTRKRVDGR
jgi:hypothetical protein